MIISGIRAIDLDKIADKIKISLIKLRNGGAAILVAEAINHHIVIGGMSVRKPLVKNKLRVLVVS
jgi:hypothetical protein